MKNFVDTTSSEPQREWQYTYIHAFPKFVLEPQTRIRKPSKRLQAVDPLAPITPVPPRAKVQRKVPETPMTKFAARRIRGSQNKKAARVLFTPRASQHGTGPDPANEPPPSPTPLQAHQPQPFSTSSPGSSSSQSGAEDRVRVRLERLNLQPQASGSQSPRAGPHSKPTKAPLKHRPKGGAKDVWQFFKKEAGCNTCILCQCVTDFIALITNELNYFYRQTHAADPSHHISTFKDTTSTSTMRKHLFTDHVAEWVKSCEDLSIPITAPPALKAIQKFRKEPAATPLESERPQYSKEAFIDAIVDFVVGDDQVCY